MSMLTARAGWLMMAGALLLAAAVLFAPAFYVAHQLKQQLSSQDYSPQLEKAIDTFVAEESSQQPKRHKALQAAWQGDGQHYLDNNLAKTDTDPAILLDATAWHLRPLGLNTLAVDGDLKVATLRVQVGRYHLVKWRVQGICLLDSEATHTRCAFSAPAQ